VGILKTAKKAYDDKKAYAKNKREEEKSWEKDQKKAGNPAGLKDKMLYQSARSADKSRQAALDARTKRAENTLRSQKKPLWTNVMDKK